MVLKGRVCVLEGRDVWQCPASLILLAATLSPTTLLLCLHKTNGILNIEQENSVYSIHSLQGHDLNEARFTLPVWFSNIVNKSCVVRKVSYYPGQSQGSFHQKYNNLTITLFLHCFSCYWLIFSLHFLSQSKQRVFSALPRVELNSFNFHVRTEESYYF